MLLGTDELQILRGSKFYGTWQWVNSVTGDPEDFAGMTATIKIKNIHEDFIDVKNMWEVGIATVEPLDIDNNSFKGRVDIELSKEDTLYFALPTSEDDRYGESDFYSILDITLSTGEVILQAKVRVIESLESESINVLVDDMSEAIRIKQKLDEIMANNDAFQTQRDTYVETIGLAAENVTISEANIENIKVEVTQMKDDVTDMKTGIETIFDNFDDRFLGTYNFDPIVDNDGEVLRIGTIYYNSTQKELRFYNGVSWDSPVGAAQTYAMAASQSSSDANDAKIIAIDKADIATNKLAELLLLEQELLEYKNDSEAAALSSNSAKDIVLTKADEVVQDKLSVGLSEQNALEYRDASFQNAQNAEASILTINAAKDTVILRADEVAQNTLTVASDTLDASSSAEAARLSALEAQTLVTNGITLGTLPDVELNTVINGDVIVYNSATSRFENSFNLSELHTHDNKTILDNTTASFTTADQSKLNTIEENATADQTKEEIEAFNINAATVNDLTIETAVPINAKFTDTIYDDSTTTKQGNSFNGAEQLVKLDANGKLPAIDGSNLINVSSVASINDLTDVNTNPSIDDVLMWDGTNWIAGVIIAQSSSINTPSIISPTTGAIDTSISLTFTTSNYSTSITFTGSHTGTVLQIATDAAFTTIVETITVGLENLTANSLVDNTTYHARVRFISGDNSSEWSDAITFTTIDAGISKPSILTPIDLSIDNNLVINATSSAYEAIAHSEALLSTDWQISSDLSFTAIISESLNDTTNKTSWTSSALAAVTTYYMRIRYKSSTYISGWSNTISFTTADVGVNKPIIISPTNGAIDTGKNTTTSASAFSAFNTSEPHFSSSWQISTDIGFSTIISESLNDTTNKTSWTSGNLEVSTTYYARVKYKTASYESAYSETISFTTKALFTPTIGTQGLWGFGTAPTDGPFAVLGLAEMTGTNTAGHANYGNYIHSNGSIVCWRPKAFYRIGHASSSRYATYGANAVDIVGTETFANESEANAGGYILHRVFINNGAEQAGYFHDKYMNSKDGTTAGKSVFGGNPIGMTTNATYNPSSTMTGCTGILADAVTLSRARGARWNCSSAFMYAWAAMISVAHGQAATNTTDCAWYDAAGTTNFPKGCNNNALSDTNDSSVVYATAGDGNANKPKTGATSNFNKTTDNGCANGIADLNGGLFEVPIGITNFGTSATATTAITNDTIYVLKESVDHASLTGGWNGSTDAWGAAATLAARFDAITSPHPLGSSTGVVYWGNGTNAVFSADASGVNRSLCGFIPKNSSASNATGINMLGNDYFYKYGIQNQVPLCCGLWNNAAIAGLFCRNFTVSRSADVLNASFRASAYFG